MVKAESYEGLLLGNKKHAYSGDITPRHYKGYALKDIIDYTRHDLKLCGVTFNYSSGQYLNSTYGILDEVGQVEHLLGASMDFNIYATYPVILSGGYSWQFDKIGGVEFDNKSLYAFFSIVAFPWFYSDKISILPNIGIGVQKTSIEQIENTFVQPLYKIGIIINFPDLGILNKNSRNYSFQIVSNYYRSVNVANQPHALSSINIGFGISWW